MTYSPTITMTSTTTSPLQDPLAAAVAAAAELAMSSGATAYFLNSAPQQQRVQVQVRSTGVVSESECSTATNNTPITTSVSTWNHPQAQQVQESSEDEEVLHDSHSEDEEEEEEEDPQVRMARSRERNREHARRTRLRKKAQLESLQSKVKGLQAESQVLQQSLEECSIASILVGLSTATPTRKLTDSLLQVVDSLDQTHCQSHATEILQLVGGKRKRFVSPEAIDHKSASNQPLQLKINGKTTLIGGDKTHINWKTGVYSEQDGTQRQLTQKQLASLRYVPYSLLLRECSNKNISLTHIYTSLLHSFQTRTQSHACQNDPRSQKELYCSCGKDYSRTRIQQYSHEEGSTRSRRNAFQKDSRDCCCYCCSQSSLSGDSRQDHPCLRFLRG